MGHPLAVYCDGGSHFKLDVKIMLEPRNIAHYVAPPYHPQSVGLAESVVQLIIQRLRKLHVDFADDVEQNWDQYIEQICVGINTRDLRHFGCTPSQLMFGRNVSGRPSIMTPREAAVLSLEIKADNEREALDMTSRWNDAAKNWMADREEMQDAVTRRRLILQDLEISRATERMGKPLAVDDLVLLRRHVIDKGRTKKWMERWEGPFRIFREVKKRCSYELCTLDRSRVKGRYSIDSLKPFISRHGEVGDLVDQGEHIFKINPDLKGIKELELRGWRNIEDLRWF